MPEMTLQEAQGRIGALEGQISSLTSDVAAKDAKIAELTEAGAAKDARIAELLEADEKAKGNGIVDAQLAEAKLPQLTVKRLAESLKAALPIADGKLDESALKDSVKTAIDEAVAELAEVRKGSPVTGMGYQNPYAGDSEAAKKSLHESAKRHYLDEGKDEAEADRLATLFANGR